MQIACLLLDIYYLSEAALADGEEGETVEVDDILDGLLRNILGSFQIHTKLRTY